MKNHLILLLLGASTLVPVSFAQTPATPAAAPAATWTVTPTFVSQYMFRGTRLGGASFQPTVEYATGPLTLGLWSNAPLSAKVPGQSDPELDPYAAYTIDLAKDLTLQPGAILYTYPSAEKNNGFYKTTFEPSLALNYTMGGVKLTPKVYRDVVLEQTLWELNVAFAVPMKEIGSELDFVGSYGTFKATSALENTNPHMKNWGDYWLAGVSLPFQINKESKVTIGWSYTEGGQNFLKQGSAPKVENGAAAGRGVFSLSYAITF
jgi:uncharacterized protein (TIGR02001 family)